jgi:hypothetical protein
VFHYDDENRGYRSLIIIKRRGNRNVTMDLGKYEYNAGSALPVTVSTGTSKRHVFLAAGTEWNF